MKKEKLKQKFITYFIFCMIVILIANHSIERNLPSVYNDEFGYWASAAYFSGYDWSDIFSQIQYYSYGYGLLLSLLIFISKSTQTAYRLALSLNGLWIGLSFLVLNLICKKLYPNMQFKKRIIISLISTFFASNVVQLNYTWPECLLYLLFCMNFYLILMLNEKITYIKLIVLSALLILEYAIHQRTLSIILATLLTVGLLIFQKGHDSRKKSVFLFLAIILFFFIHSVLKDLIISRVWNNSASSEVNNMGNQINKLEYLFSINGIKNFFLIFLGRIYYLSISSFLLIVYSIERLIQKLKQDYLNKRSNFISIFLLFSLLFALGISTISTLSSDFTDVSHMVYGRYIDNLFGPFILISLSEIELVKKNIHKLFSYTNLLIILGLSVSLLWEIYKPVWVSSINNAGISLFVSKDEIRVWPGIAVTLIGALIIYEITHLNINDNLKYGLVSIILVSFWFFNGTNAYHMFEDSNNISIQESSKRCAQVIRKLDDEYNGSISIYADRTEEISGKWEAFSGNGIQFLLNDKKVFYVNLEEEKAKLSKKDCIILLPVTHDIPNNFSLIESTEKYNLIIPIKSKLYKFIS